MEPNEKNLTPTEWHLMECLWEHAPRTGREAAAYMARSQGWSRSTTLTLLRRMTAKGFIDCHEENGINVYAPLLDRADAAVRETESFLSRVYRGSVSTLLSAVTQRQSLTKAEIDELYDIIRQAEEVQRHDE
ncbi:MAG: BlaI/MecI/CopY family transcriptional regulator [Oscillospiraceae bacterium]|nr:BlaI/MecI/CopY family transcriptional regulator [Oscillospiraceae bacterium]